MAADSPSWRWSIPSLAARWEPACWRASAKFWTKTTCTTFPTAAQSPLYSATAAATTCESSVSTSTVVAADALARWLLSPAFGLSLVADLIRRKQVFYSKHA